ncbi:MAG TPA: hypothetical protein VJZ32_03060 [Candidatus Bathyarchaeia archaeon]|nr:hypothetical protein [Candidatus Bathyarchaeia archaeon]
MSDNTQQYPAMQSTKGMCAQLNSSGSSPKSGINFICSKCGALLHHIGAGADGTNSSTYPRQPVSEILKTCPECERELIFDIDLSSVKINGLKDTKSDSALTTSKIIFTPRAKQR